MAGNDDFYIHLPSNSSSHIFPDNTTATYCTALAKRISLPGDGWTAALLELQYPQTLYNVLPGENTLRVQFGTLNNDSESSPLVNVFSRREIPPGHIATREAFVSALNTAVSSFFACLGTPYFILNADGYVSTKQLQASDKSLDFFDLNEHEYLSSNSVQAIAVPSEALNDKAVPKLLHLNESLAHQLGFSSGNFDLYREKPYRAERGVELDLGLPPQCYIYCDVLEDSLVGHSLVPLLRSIPIARGPFGTTITHSVENPIYVPVNTREFSTIEINLRDNAGRPLPFVYGHSSALVHFRRRV